MNKRGVKRRSAAYVFELDLELELDLDLEETLGVRAERSDDCRCDIVDSMAESMFR